MKKIFISKNRDRRDNQGNGPYRRFPNTQSHHQKNEVGGSEQKSPDYFVRGNQPMTDQVYEGRSNGGTGKDSIRIVPLGGAGNVTKNMYVYEYRYDGKIQDILIVDCGIGFPEADMFGVDLILPDVRYLADKRDKIRGLVFTHGHDDHIGGIPYIYPKLGKVPMYGPTLAAAFANLKLKETPIKERVRPMSYDKQVHAGAFTVSFIRITHSVPDTAHLIIETPIGIFYHGADFKFDPTPLDGKPSEIEKINAVGRRGVLCMMSDSLGSERPGFTPSEQIIGETIEKELRLCNGKVLFTTQSSKICPPFLKNRMYLSPNSKT